MKPDTTLAVAGSFTIEPLADALEFWWARLGLQVRTTFAPFNQVFQQLLDPAGALAQASAGAVLVRWEDLVRLPEDRAAVSRAAGELAALLARWPRPALVLLCEPSPAAVAALGAGFLARTDDALAAAVPAGGPVRVMSAAALRGLYPVAAPHDPYGARTGAVPYTPDQYSALGTVIARDVARRRFPPPKVIVLDCDHTLWRGVCAEDGPAGVEPRLEVQRVMAAQLPAGVLLCLCSRNEPADVHAAFAAHRGMPLSRASFVAERINWSSKPRNLESLAAELGLGLDRFVMVDDDPLECERIRRECPAVVTVELPAAAAPARQLLEHLWPLDLRGSTAEDRRRTVSYREERARAESRAAAPSLVAFLAALELEVDLVPLEPAHVERVAQLTRRTTQFNLTGRQYEEAALLAEVTRGETRGLVASVRDRFGDYGLVGAVLYHGDADCEVDAFVLSCRALGRGVEHRMLAELGRLGGMVRLPFTPTARNTPAREFLRAQLPDHAREGGRLYELPAAVAARVTYAPSAEAPAAAPRQEDAPSPAAGAPDWAAIARDLGSVDRIHADVKRARQRVRAGAEWSAPRTPTEATLAAIWASVLGLDRVSRDDDFFALGGHSLAATRVMSMVCADLGVELSLGTLFRASTPAALAAVVDAAAREVAPRGAPPRPAPLDRHEPFAPTDLQQAFWVGRGAAFEMGGVGTHSYAEVEFEGLDLARYQAAWQATIDRHDMLRCVVLPDGQLHTLRRVPPYRIEVLDLRGRRPFEAEASLQQRRREMSVQVLESDRWPLFEVRATLLDGGRVRIHLSFDGLMHDLWSQRMLLREVARRYEEPRVAWPEHTFTFRDYALALRGAASSPQTERARVYWRGRAETLAPGPELPLARDPASIERPRFVRRSARLPAATWARLRERAAAHALTPAALLVAAFAEVLGTWSRSRRFTLNLPMSVRRPFHPDVKELIGQFTSVTLLEVDGGAVATFAGRARAVQARMWRDLDHAEVSGVEVVRDMARTRGRVPVLPVVFTSSLELGVPDVDVAPAGVPARQVHGITQTPQVWLDNQVNESGGQLVVDWDVVEELFPAGLIDAMFDAHQRLLHELAACDEAWEAESGVKLPERDRETRAAVNATAVERPDELLHELFERQVPANAARPAVIARDRTLSHLELAKLARRLARLLRAEGVAPGSLVGVALPKGWEQVVSVLGVLMAGGAYLPLDPGLPQERRWKLARHGELAVVLTQAGSTQSWPAGVRAVEVSDDALASSNDAPLEPSATPADLAYVIYTSGSSGEPKGVMVEHRAAANTLSDLNRRFGVVASDRVLALAALSFDLSVYDVFGVLAAGGAVVMPAPAAFPDPASWVELAARHAVTIWNSVPAQMDLALSHAALRGEALPPSLRLVFLSGDWIPTSLPGTLRARAPGARLIAMGGATEAAIWSIWHDVVHVDPTWPSIPYGRPLENQTWHVLDEELAPRPVWVPGSLYIGGRGLARGYWRDEARTAERFFVHPHTGERLYRTGDLGRYHPDGTIEFLGREDFQVKVHGFRVETGEVETALREHPAVEAAVVVASGEPREARQLVACVVTRRGVAAEELRRFVGDKLPAYMVPARVVPLDRLPLTGNGKVDRQALAACCAASSAPAPATCTELVSHLAALMAEVLGVSAVDARVSFIALGGDSLRGMKLISAIQESVGERLSGARMASA